MVATKAGQAYFRKPNRGQYQKFMSMLFDDKRRAEANLFLARACVVHPSLEVFETYIDSYPFSVNQCATAIMSLAGGDETETKNFVKGAAET
jgi:hypothetical protein